MTTVVSDLYHHWSSSGVLVSEWIHAGTEEAARQRGEAMSQIPWDSADLAPEVPAYWRPGSQSKVFVLRLLAPPLNTVPVRDDKVYDLMGHHLPIQYWNEVEDAGSVSVLAPLELWEVA